MIFRAKRTYGDGPKVYCEHCKNHQPTTIIEVKGNIKLKCDGCGRY